jgi:CBS-domain-containing membrane protein
MWIDVPMRYGKWGSLESRMAFLQAVINSASEILDFGECTSSAVRLTFLSISPVGQPWSTSTSNSAASLVDSYTRSLNPTIGVSFALFEMERKAEDLPGCLVSRN